MEAPISRAIAQQPSPHSVLLTIRETSYLLRISARTVYRLIESGEIAAIRIGKQWRVPSEPLRREIAEKAAL